MFYLAAEYGAYFLIVPGIILPILMGVAFSLTCPKCKKHLVDDAFAVNAIIFKGAIYGKCNNCDSEND